jgi:heat shock protein HslJ
MKVDGVERPVSTPRGHAPILQFRPDLGLILGNTGCNMYSAPYTLDGDALRLKGLGQTLMGCAEPVIAVEDDYLAALQRIGRFVVSDGGATLILSSDDGSVRLTYHRSEGA